MSITVSSKGSSGAHDASPEVSVSGMDIVVAADTFRVCNKEYVLEQDLVITTVNRPYSTSYTVWAVEEISTGNLTLLVDEFIRDGVDSLYDFAGMGVYKPLTTFVTANVPANSSDLDSADIRVTHFVPSQGGQ